MIAGIGMLMLAFVFQNLAQRKPEIDSGVFGGEGNTIQAILLSSVLLWVFHFLILRGVQQATGLNNIVTVAKIVPIFAFVLIILFSFKPDIFIANFWGGQGYEADSLWNQVRSTMLVTVFVFLGIEGASKTKSYSRLGSGLFSRLSSLQPSRRFISCSLAGSQSSFLFHYARLFSTQYPL